MAISDEPNFLTIFLTNCLEENLQTKQNHTQMNTAIVEKRVCSARCPSTDLALYQSLAVKFGYFGGILYLSNGGEYRHVKYVSGLHFHYGSTLGITFLSIPYPLFQIV